MNFEGSNAVVTGGARGIGRTISEKLTDLGASVAVVDINKDLAESFVQELEDKGKKAVAIAADVTDTESIGSVMDQVESVFRSVDMMVNNAGVQIRCPSTEFSEKDWDRLMDINLKAVFFWSQAAAKIMIRQGSGSIVNISSGNSVKMMPGRAPYCISKAGVNALTAVLGIEWASKGVRVNAVAPGWIMTDMVKEGMRLGVVNEEQVLSITPIGRLAEPMEIAEIVVFLLSSESRYMIGQTVFVDGGWSAVGLPDMKYFRS